MGEIILRSYTRDVFSERPRFFKDPSEDCGSQLNRREHIILLANGNAWLGEVS